MVFINQYGLYMVNITQTWLIHRGNAPLVCETDVMWLKQCHNPSPSHIVITILIGGMLTNPKWVVL